MRKTIHSHEQLILSILLRTVREEVGMTQKELANQLNWQQTLVSRSERGDRRLDFIEAHEYCKALGIDFSEFTSRYLRALEANNNYQPPVV